LSPESIKAYDDIALFLKDKIVLKLLTQNTFGYQIGYQQPHQAFDKKEQKSYQIRFFGET
jgi:hypothetical protein